MYFSKVLCNYKSEDIPFISRDTVSQKRRTVVIRSVKNWLLFHVPGVKCACYLILDNWRNRVVSAVG